MILYISINFRGQFVRKGYYIIKINTRYAKRVFVSVKMNTKTIDIKRLDISEIRWLQIGKSSGGRGIT